MARRPRKVLISLRIPEAMRDELIALAAESSRAAGRPVTRSDVERQMLADGIRRARAAPRYAARFAEDIADG